MELIINWTPLARKKLRTIYRYYKKKANKITAEKIVNGIVDESIRLTHSPNIGQLELLLTERKEVYRYLVYSNYKIIYWIKKDTNSIEISNVFDTRQNPNKIVEIKN